MRSESKTKDLMGLVFLIHFPGLNVTSEKQNSAEGFSL